MNEADKGPRCSLISYVVPPGLSRVPVIEPANFQEHLSPVESVSVRPYSSKSRTSTVAATALPLPPPPVERISAQAGTSSSVLQLDQPSSKSPKKSSAEVHPEAPSRRPPRSCLTARSARPVVPAKFNLRKKTVAFGKTVNVSQTIEGTSRIARQRQAMRKSSLTKQETIAESCNKENEHKETDDEKDEKGSLLLVLNDVKSSLDVLKARDEARANELAAIRQAMDTRGKEIDLLRGMLADYFGRDYRLSLNAKASSSIRREEAEEEKTKARSNANNPRSPSPRENRRFHRSPLSIKDVEKAGMRDDCDADEVDGITFKEFRRLLATNPALRQFVADIRQEEIDERNGYADRRRPVRSDPPSSRDSPRRGDHHKDTTSEIGKRVYEERHRETRGAKFTEKVTVERSIRCSPPQLAPYSVDTRRFLEDQFVQEESGDMQSIYRPGESVTYYPEKERQQRYARDSPSSDEVDERVDRRYNDYPAAEERRTPWRDRRIGRRRRN